jgi:hypothetical protein
MFFFKVIASAGDETHSDIHSNEESSGSSNDYTERRSLAITVPDYSVLEIHDEKFHVRFSRTYIQISSLYSQPLFKTLATI